MREENKKINIPDPTVPFQPEHPIPANFNPTDPMDLANINNFIRTREDVPSAKPRNFIEQFVLVWSGGSARAYLYDTVNLGWRYVVLT